MAPPSSVFFLSSIRSKKMLYSTIYAAVGGIGAADWVEGGGEEVSDAEGKGEDLGREGGDGFRCLARFCTGVGLVVVGGDPAAFAVSFFT